MATYAVSFEFKYDDSYSDRYNSFVSYLYKHIYWAETTSLILVESSRDIADFEVNLYIMTQFDATKDKLLVIEVQYDNAIARGKFANTTNLQKLLYGISIK